MEDLVIRELENRDCVYLASLHAEYFTPSVVSAFGEGFLRSAYRGMRNSRYGKTILLTKGSETLGFATIVYDESRFFREILGKQGLTMAALILKSLLLHPRLLRNVLGAMRYPRYYSGLTKAELLTLIAREDRRGQGTGTLLVEEVVRLFRQAGVRKFKVSVKKDWTRAVEFYKKRGFELLGEVDDGKAGMLFFLFDTGKDVRHD
jgi:ribosomal protein S18 acetylase RimI-like enzyme